jgi:hypothetical protein
MKIRNTKLFNECKLTTKALDMFIQSREIKSAFFLYFRYRLHIIQNEKGAAEAAVFMSLSKYFFLIHRMNLSELVDVSRTYYHFMTSTK